MITTSISQVFYNTSILQVAGCTHGKNSFHITCSAYALSAKAGFSPEYALANNPFGSVIGWLNILIFYKRPEMSLMFKDIATFAAQLAINVRSGVQQRFHPLLEFRHSALKRFPLQGSLTDPFSHLQYLLGQPIKLKANCAQFAIHFTKRLKIAFQMRPAYLANEFVKIIGVKYLKEIALH